MPNVTPPGTAPQTNVATFTDFTGGLNTTTDNFNLSDNESPYCRNVDFDARGGVARRRGWTEEVLVGAARAFGTAYDDEQAIYHLVWSNRADELYYWKQGDTNATQLLRDASIPGANQTDVVENTVVATDTSWTADWMYWAGFEGDAYGTRGFQTTPQVSVKYDVAGVNVDTASSITAMTDPATTAWQDDYDTPSGAHMPMSRYIATHNTQMWVAYTTEDSTTYPSRVRWSHPNDPGSWRENDYIDINPGDEDGGITAIVPFKDHLVVFKEQAVYVIFGYSPETFQVIKAADHVGAVGQNAVCVSEYGVFFYDRDKGVSIWDGNGVRWLFEKLIQMIHQGDIEQPEATQMAYLNHRLWCGVRWNDSANTYAGRQLIWDPKTSAWTMYTGFDIEGADGVDNFMNGGFEFGSPTTRKPYIALEFPFSGDQNSIMWVDAQNTYSDSVIGGYITFNTRAEYQTKWIDLGSPAHEKRWRRPEFVLSGGYAQTTSVGVMKDWNGGSAVKTLSLEQTAVSGVTLWGTATWGTDAWSEQAELYHDVLRGGSLGATSRSIAFLFEAPLTDNEWHVDAFMVKYRPKRLK